METAKIGKITKEVINILGLDLECDTPIYIGESNYHHMLEKHKQDFIRFGTYIDNIISNPDFVGINPKDKSLEYVKEFKIEDEFVKVAVRVSGGGNHFVRSLYVLNKNRVKKFVKAGKLKKVD